MTRKRLFLLLAAVALTVAGGALATTTGTTQTFTYTVPGTTFVVPDRVFTQTIQVPTVTVTVPAPTTTTAPTTTSTTPSSGPWVVAPPQAPVTYVTNPYSLGLNVNNVSGATYNDYAIDGGGDSSVLLQGGSHGNTLNRFRITRTAANPVVSWGKHGMYIFAYNNAFNDIWEDNTGGNGVDAFSVRMHGNTFTRTQTNNYALCLGYFEEDFNAGVTTFKNARCTFTESDTAVWVDIEGSSTFPSSVHESFVFDHADFWGPSGANFFRSSGKMDSSATVTIICSTINGRAVTSSDVVGVASSSVHISGC